MPKPAARIPELIRDWSEIATDVLVDAGIEAEQAGKLGMRIVRNLCETHAGQQFYMPIWLAQRITERDRKIAAAASAGMDPGALAQEYKLHLTTIYAIIRRVAAVELAERQSPLFADDNE